MKFKFNWPRRRCLKILTDDRVTGILLAHLGAFGSGELKMCRYTQVHCWSHLCLVFYSNVYTATQPSFWFEPTTCIPCICQHRWMALTRICSYTQVQWSICIFFLLFKIVYSHPERLKSILVLFDLIPLHPS